MIKDKNMSKNDLIDSPEAAELCGFDVSKHGCQGLSMLTRFCDSFPGPLAQSRGKGNQYSRIQLTAWLKDNDARTELRKAYRIRNGVEILPVSETLQMRLDFIAGKYDAPIKRHQQQLKLIRAKHCFNNPRQRITTPSGLNF